MGFRPMNDHVLVQRKASETKSGLIELPANAVEKNVEGTVLAVGRGKADGTGRFIETTVKVGDRVLFGKYSGVEIKIEGEERLILREEDILGVIDS